MQLAALRVLALAVLATPAIAYADPPGPSDGAHVHYEASCHEDRVDPSS